MGDIADYDVEQGMDMYYDHLAGHPNFRPEDCPECQDEEGEE